MFRVLVYIGDTIHEDETVQTIEYIFHDPIKMNMYLMNTSNIMRERGKYFNHVIEEIKLEENLVEKDEKDLT